MRAAVSKSLSVRVCKQCRRTLWCKRKVYKRVPAAWALQNARRLPLKPATKGATDVPTTYRSQPGIWCCGIADELS